MRRNDQVVAIDKEFRFFDTGGPFDPQRAFQFQNISFGGLGLFVRDCTDADPERTLLLQPSLVWQVDVVDKCQPTP